MRFGKRSLAAVAAGALGAALVPFVGVGAASAAVTSLTATTAVAAATAYTTPGSSDPTNLMDLITITGDDTFATSTSQYVVSIRLDSAPADDTGTGFAAIQLSAKTGSPTVGTAYATNASGTVVTPAPTVTVPSNYVWTRGSVVQITNNVNTARAFTLKGTAPNAGTYGFTAWVNNTSSNFNSLEPGEPFATGTLTVGGTVASLTVTPASQSVGASQTAEYLVTAKDSSGRATFPTGSASGSTGSWANIFTTPSGASIVADGSSTTTGTLSAAAFITAPSSPVQGTAAFTMSSATAGTYGINVGPGGTLPGTVTPGTATLSVSSVATLASAVVTGPSAVSSNATTYTAPLAITAGNSGTTNNIYVPFTQGTVTFQMTAASGTTAGQLLPYTVTDGPTGQKAGVTAGAFTTAVNSSLQVSVPITATAAANNDYYTVTLGQGTSRVIYQVNYGAPQLFIENVSTTPKLGTTGFVVTNTATTIVAKVTDQYGQPLSNILVRSVPTVSAAASGTTGTDGLASINIPAPGATITSQTVAFTALAPLASSAVGPTPTVVNLVYNASGAPSSLTLSTAAGNVAASASAIQLVDTSGAQTATWANSTTVGWMPVTVVVGGASTPVSVAFSAPNAYFADTASIGSLTSAAVEAGSTSASTSSGTVTVYVKPTKTGTVTVTARAGTLESTITWKVANQSTDARILAVTPAKQDAAGIAQVTANVTDVFGNAVANASLNFSELGVGNFASGTSTLSTATGPTGSVTVDVLSTQAGDSAVTVLGGSSGQWVAAAGTPLPNSPAAVSSGAAEIKFTSGGNKSITIVGERTTVGGKPGIKVDGATNGFIAGDVVKPWVKFPGQTAYEQGSARPELDSAGDFKWQRKTGKKTYVYFTNEAGNIQSNRVIIAAN